jgi:hypothetical protein
MIKKHAAASVIFALSLNAFSQNNSAETTIKASDPTQLYSTLAVDGGINMIDYDADNWEFGFGAAVAVKSKFRFSFFAPISNIALGPSLFTSVNLDAACQIHNNSGLYNSSVITVGLSTPVFDDFFMARTNNFLYTTSHELRIAYTGGLRFSDKLALFPQVEVFRKFSDVSESYINMITGNTQNGPKLTHLGLRTGFSFSYDFNHKNFVQLRATYSRSGWEEENTFDAILNGNNFRTDQYDFTFIYQHAFTPNSQIFLQLYQQLRNIENNGNTFQDCNLSGFKLGFIYFLN